MVQDSWISASFLGQSLQPCRKASVHFVTLRMPCLRDAFHILQKAQSIRHYWNPPPRQCAGQSARGECAVDSPSPHRSTEEPELKENEMIFVVYSDGACRGNPGPMAIGASVQDDNGTELATVSQLLGKGTNNIAEYRAAIEGLKKAQSQGATEIELRMDSELVVRQINGQYKVKNVALKPLHAEILELLKTCAWSTVAHVPRQENQRADELANLAFEMGIYQPEITTRNEGEGS